MKKGVTALLLVIIEILLSGCVSQTQKENPDLIEWEIPSLWKEYSKYFEVGAAIEPYQFEDSPAERELLLKHFSISELFGKYPPKYGFEISNHYHLLKSLVYFEDAEKQPMPTMLKLVTWEEIKKKIIVHVSKAQEGKTMPT